MNDAVAVGAWVVVYDGTDVKYLVSPSDRSVEFSFTGHPEFNLEMTEQVLQRCVEVFAAALHDLKAAVASA